MKIFFILLLIVLLPVISACSRDDSSYSIDIYDKDVSGYKLSESLLKYFTIQDIKKMSKNKENRDYISYELALKTDDADGIKFTVRKDDPHYIVYSIQRYQFFGKNNIKLCE